MKHVLVVDDDRPFGWLLEKILSPEFKVSFSTNGMDALDMISSTTPPDLIITDLGLPVISGEELLRNIKSSGLYSHIPVMVLTASLDPEVEERCMTLGADSYIVKPFEPEGFKTEVQDLFRKSDLLPA